MGVRNIINWLNTCGCPWRLCSSGSIWPRTPPLAMGLIGRHGQAGGSPPTPGDADNPLGSARCLLILWRPEDADSMSGRDTSFNPTPDAGYTTAGASPPNGSHRSDP